MNKPEFLQPKKSDDKPVPGIFDLTTEDHLKVLQLILTENPHTQVIDTYDAQLEELFILQNPWLRNDPEKREKEFQQYQKDHYGDTESWQAGKWIHLPWRHTVLHVLDDDQYQEVRTGRNRNLITADEQKKYYNSVIGIAGQSVGNSVTLSIVLTGGGKHMRIADPDRLELTNLNRIRSSIAEITNYKVHMTAHQIYELDPYAQLDLFEDGLTEENIERFFDSPPKLDVVIDEIDSLPLKVRIREEAKKRGIPVLMAADNGDSGVIDIERYDHDPNLPFFHGRVTSGVLQQIKVGKVPPPAIGQIIGRDLIGFDIHEERMMESLLEIGKSIPTWPQLGTAASLNGALMAVAVRKVITGQPLINSRVNVSVPSMLVPSFTDPNETESRQNRITKMAQDFNAKIEAILNGKKP